MRFFIFALALFSAFSLPVYAQEDKPLSIAVVDVQQLMNDSKAAQSIQRQGKDLLKDYQEDIKNLEEKLKKNEQKVIDARKAEDEAAFKKEFEAFQKSLQDSRKEQQKLGLENDKAVAEALNVLRGKIVEIVNEMTVENKYDLVITRADILTVSRDIDITAEVMTRLNKDLKTVKVKK
jgi:Skp family chaperone for outer membrane proteins